MKMFRATLRFLLMIFGIHVVWGLLILFFEISSLVIFSEDSIIARFLSGFWRFLAANIPLISWNAATWGPGLGAFLIAVVLLHKWLSRWAARTGRPWTFATSFCLVSLVPVLFVISFLVPGVLVQWEMLREAGRVEANR